MTEQTASLLLIDSHDGVRRVLARRLHAIPGLRVVGETSSTYHGKDLAGELRPDVILFDCNTSGAYAAELVSGIRQASPESTLIVFTSFLTPSEERMYLEAGADCCLLKGMAVGDLAAELLHRADGRREASMDGANYQSRTTRS